MLTRTSHNLPLLGGLIQQTIQDQEEITIRTVRQRLDAFLEGVFAVVAGTLQKSVACLDSAPDSVPEFFTVAI